MSTNLAQYLPAYYDGITETSELIKVENELFDELNQNMSLALDDHFILTCSLEVLRFWEIALNITYNPATETVEFRRIRVINRLSETPPLTLRWLRQRLDALIGSDYYEMRVDHDLYTLHLVLSIDEQPIFDEINTFIRRVIPANIVFILTPLMYKRLEIETQLLATKAEYKRMGTWVMGVTPFLTKGDYEEVEIC